MIWEPRHPRRWLLAVGACAAVFLMGKSRPAAAASAEDCRAFHQECTEARAAGYRDVGICNVERLECPAGPDAGVPKRSPISLARQTRQRWRGLVSEPRILAFRVRLA